MALDRYGLTQDNGPLHSKTSANELLPKHTANPSRNPFFESISEDTSFDEATNLYISPVNSKTHQAMIRKHLVILANTGERVRREITFSTLSIESNSLSAIESDPLLGRGHLNIRNFQRTVRKGFKRIAYPFIQISTNTTYQAVIKCSIAYLLASLAVYWTPFDNWLGSTDSKHVVATVAVYFHPARSKGSMHQTLIYVVISLLFSFTVSFGCRSVSTIFFNNGEDEISYCIDLVISSISFGLISYVKTKVNKATFNTACSLASIAIVSCVVKEGSLNSANIPLERLHATFQVVVTGCVISVACCYLLWPIRAVDELRSSLNDSYNIMSSVLSTLANRFLAGESLNEKDSQVFKALNKNIAELFKNNEEAKYELLSTGREEEWNVFNELVHSTISLSRHLHALRSSTEMQWSLLHADSPNHSHNDNESLPSLDSYSSQTFRMSHSQDEDPNSNESTHNAHDSSQLFDLFVYYLSPSMKSLIFTIKGILGEVPFEKKSELNPNVFARTVHLQNSLNEAIKLFESKQTESFEKLYDQDVFKGSTDFLFKTDLEEVTACCGNFSSLLALFASELMDFLKLAETYEDARANSRSWSWLKLWKSKWNSKTKKERSDLKKNDHSTLNAALLDLQSQYHKKPSTEQKVMTRLDQWSHNLWRVLKVFRKSDVQFGIRVGLGALLLSSFAFLPWTKELFNNWRGEWALTVYCIMMNKSLGGTTMTAKWRFVGTFIGAICAFICWDVTDGNPYALAITGFVISIPSFYIILFWKKNNPFGRFILLTYNLTALYSYSMVQKDGEDDKEGGEDPIIGEIAFHRFIAVSIGIVWALIMASCFLPTTARARLKSGITILWLRLGVIWNSSPLDYDPTTLRLVGLKDEKGITGLLAECETLLKQAPIEFRLKGSFPEDTYSKLLKSTSIIIDTYENMNLMIKVDPLLSPNELYVLNYIETEREEVEHRIFLIFYMIASAMRLGIPLPNKPASTEHAKDRMLYKLSEIRNRNTDKNEVVLTNNDFILLYSYILVTSSITAELDTLIDLIKELLGDITADNFELV